MSIHLTRRDLLYRGLMLGVAGGLTACGSTGQSVQRSTRSSLAPKVQTARKISKIQGNNMLRVIASSGFGSDWQRNEEAFTRLQTAGFVLNNQQAAYRRFQRFAGTDAERIADMQDIASGKVATPKVIMGYRGGYGAQRLLPYIDFASLGARMQEQGTLFFGFSDVCALQLALLAKSKTLSFAGPMVYSEFGKPKPSSYTMQSFVNCVSNPQHSIIVPYLQAHTVRPIEGIFWGGNLSILAALVGTPYCPDIQGGILFLEDVGEQPYRIERMLQTLLLSGILKKQQALVLGDFRMEKIRDVYDASYNLNVVAHTISRAAKIPVYTHFPFGHVSNKNSFPLGGYARLSSWDNGGYRVDFQNYPHLDAKQFALETLLNPLPTAAETAAESNVSDGEE